MAHLQSAGGAIRAPTGRFNASCRKLPSCRDDLGKGCCSAWESGIEIALSNRCFLMTGASLCLMSNTSPKFVNHGYSGSQTHPCSDHAVAIYARVLGSAPTSAGAARPSKPRHATTRARRGFCCWTRFEEETHKATSIRSGSAPVQHCFI
jgi:hypothetical protein